MQQQQGAGMWAQGDRVNPYASTFFGGGPLNGSGAVEEVGFLVLIIHASISRCSYTSVDY